VAPRRVVADLADGGLAWRSVGGARVAVALEAQALEEAQDAALQRALEAVDVVAGEVRRLVEGDGDPVVPGEEAVEEHDVEVEVGI
jgi:hypothetical protein